MPTYQYACTACGHELEAVQSFSDPALTECPTCEGRLRKVFGSVGVVFKGSGFYRTDSRSESGKAKSESADASATSSSATSSSSSPSSSDTKESKTDKGSKDSKGTSSTSESTSSKKPVATAS